MFGGALDGSGGCTAGRVWFGRLTLALFLLCQASDGVLTYAAVRLFGEGIEGNPILATWMGLAGAGPTLLVAKLGASLCGVILYVRGTHHALATLTALYLAAAVGPWLYVFATR